MSEGTTYRFDSSATDYSTAFLVDGEKVGYLAQPVFLPIGTSVSLTEGREGEVLGTRLDVSNVSGYAMVYIDVRLKNGRSVYEDHGLIVV